MSINESDIAFSTRIRLARNIKSVAYPQKMTYRESSEVVDRVWNSFQNSALKNDLKLFRMKDLSDNEKTAMAERHLISSELVSSNRDCAAIISNDESICIMINEEDHIRIQVFAPGLDCSKPYKTAKQIEAVLGETIDFDRDEQFGYLTSCPTNVGTGMRVCVMLHLPAIVMTHRTNALLKWAANRGMTVRGLYGEGSKANGALFQLSNQITLGISEEDILSGFNKAACSLISEERRILADIYKQNQAALTDKCLRSLGLLKNAYMISGSEATDLVSDVCTGANLGIIKDINNNTLRNALFNAMPANIVLLGAKNAQERDIRRAELMQKALI